MPDPSPRDTPSCTIRTLPPELAMEAARVAVEVFPANRPAVAQFATMVPGDASDVLRPQFIAALTTKYFGPQPRVLPVQFLDGPDAATRDLILAHMNAWDCGITFAWTQGAGRVRIARGGGGYWSYLGTDVLMVPTGPTMNLQAFTSRTPDSEYRRVVRHEAGHTLGFPHEHMRRALVDRLDRDRTVRYFMATQGWSARDVEAQVLTPLDEASLMATPADDDSVMCYQLPGGITLDGRAIPGGTDINATDRAFCLSIYPKAGPTPPPPPPPSPPPSDPATEVLAELNRARAAAGLRPLVVSAPLADLAAAWANALASLDRLTHGDAGARIAGLFPGRASGEIIAAGQETPAAVVAAWMRSPGHKRQLLGAYELAGCAVARAQDGRGTPYWVADFVGPGPDGPAPPTEPTEPTKPTKPPGPPTKPAPEPEDVGPYDLRVGDESDRLAMLPGASVLFRFRAPRKGAYVASTRGKTPLRMDLLDARKVVIDSDDDATGVGANALIAASLTKGTYYLRVYGFDPEVRGPFRVKVAAV